MACRCVRAGLHILRKLEFFHEVGGVSPSLRLLKISSQTRFGVSSISLSFPLSPYNKNQQQHLIVTHLLFVRQLDSNMTAKALAGKFHATAPT